MKFRTKGFIKTFCYRDLFIPGFTIKVKVYGPSLRSADYRRPNCVSSSSPKHSKTTGSGCINVFHDPARKSKLISACLVSLHPTILLNLNKDYYICGFLNFLPAVFLSHRQNTRIHHRLRHHIPCEFQYHYHTRNGGQYHAHFLKG